MAEAFDAAYELGLFPHELMEAAYINIFSCKEYDAGIAEQITREWFGAEECKTYFIERG